MVKLFVSLSFLVFSNFLESFGSVSKPGTCLKISNKLFNALCGMLNFIAQLAKLLFTLSHKKMFLILSCVSLMFSVCEC